MTHFNEYHAQPTDEVRIVDKKETYYSRPPIQFQINEDPWNKVNGWLANLLLVCALGGAAVFLLFGIVSAAVVSIASMFQ